VADVYEIAASGMAAQRVQMDLIAENLANAGVVRADGSVFRPKTLVTETAAPFEPALRDAIMGPDLRFSEPNDAGLALALGFDAADAAQPGGVVIAGVAESQREPQYRYEPDNPFAAKAGAHKGYVAQPEVDPIGQMIALVASGRAYDADVSMLQAAKQMDLDAADIDRA
jgi:flagellar basal-body rod protein FlgC